MRNITGQIAKMRTAAEQVADLENNYDVYAIRGKVVHLSNKKFFELFGDCRYPVQYEFVKGQYAYYREWVVIDGFEFFALIDPNGFEPIK